MLPVSTRIARVEDPDSQSGVPESWLSIGSKGSEEEADAEGERMKKRQMHRGLRIGS